MKRVVEAEPTYTRAEVAAIFGVDPQTVTRWEKAGKIGCFRTLGGHRRFRKSVVDALLSPSPVGEVAE